MQNDLFCSPGAQCLSTDCVNRVHDLSDYFIKILNDKTFWSIYKLIISPGDGHCLMHSLVTTLNYLNHDIKDYCTLFENLRWECVRNHWMYLSDFDGNVNDFHDEIEHFINNRIYDTGFCDLIPSIMSNVLNVKNVINLMLWNVYWVKAWQIYLPFQKRNLMILSRCLNLV